MAWRPDRTLVPHKALRSLPQGFFYAGCYRLAIWQWSSWHSPVTATTKIWRQPWYIAALVSWGIALFEYLLQVPANRIGFQQAGFSLGQLKIMQKVITLAVFVPLAMIYMAEPFRLHYVWAGFCMVGAVYFIFRGA